MDRASMETLAAHFDLRDLPERFYADPYEYYTALRTCAPVKEMPDGSRLLTRYRDVEQVYKNPRQYSSDKRSEFGAKFGGSPLYDHHTTSLVFNDPPYHTRVRRRINGALTPRAVQALEPALKTTVDRLLSAMARKHAEATARKDTVDLIEDFAAAIPVEVIGDLLGVPREERRPLREWSLAILGALEPRLTAAAEQSGNSAVGEFSRYLDGLIERRRRTPVGDSDLLTCLLRPGDDGTLLDAPELVHNCIFLLNAGHETTTNLIGNALVCLALNPAERARLIASPELIKPAVEEFLRFESPNQLGNRITTESVSIGGVDLETGTRITLCIGAANRDPEQFTRPHELDLARTPNRHLAFASGIHQCIGMSVARLEAAAAIAAFLGRFPGYELAAEPTRSRRARFRGFTRIPCKLQGGGESRQGGTVQ